MSPFTAKDWKDDPDHTTPLTAAALEDMETRLGAYTDTVAAGKQDASTAATDAELAAHVAATTDQAELYVPGTISSTFVSDRWTAMSNVAALASGRLHLCQLVHGVAPGKTVTGIAFWSGTTALVTPSNLHYSLWDTTDFRNFTRVAQTADEATTAAWAANSEHRLNLTAPWTNSTGARKRMYIGLVVVATTVPSVKGTTLDGGLADLDPFPAIVGTTGLSTPASVPATVGPLTGTDGDTRVIYGYVF